MFFLANLIDIYIIIIVVRAIISWFPINRYNPFIIALYNITEPVLKPIRRLIPISGIDFSPLIVILILEFIKRLLIGG